MSYHAVTNEITTQAKGQTVRLIGAKKGLAVKLRQGTVEELRWIASVEDATADLLEVRYFRVHLIHGEGRNGGGGL